MSEPVAIDASVLEPLADIRRREAALREYIVRAGQVQTKVSETVYRKVADDYRQRLASLQEQAAALQERARAEYQKLLGEYDQLTAPEEEARFAVEELQLRHLVGEIDDDQLAEGQRQPGEVIERCRAHREVLERLKAQFLQVLDSAGGAQAVAEAPSELLQASGLRRAESRAVRSPAASAPAAAGVTTDRAPMGASAPSTSHAASAVAEAPPPADDRTTVVPLGFLTIVEGPGAPAEYVLADTTYIGRGEDCHLRIVHPTVSRHHALVVAGRDGFRIRDLGSQNGTLVNGEPANDRLLIDRDEILIGEALLVFSRDRPSRLG